MKRILVWIWFVLLVGGMSTGCGHHPRRTLEKRIEARLPQLLGPARGYRVYAFGRHEQMFQGKIRALQLVGTDVEIQPGLIVNRLVAELEGIEYRREQPLVIQTGTFHATIGSHSLQSYLGSILPPVRSPWSMVVSHLDNLRVQIRAGEVRLSIDVHTRLGLKLSGELIGLLQLKTRSQIWLESRQMRIVGVSVPDKVRDLLSEIFLNRPLVDLSEVKAPVEITRVALGEESFIIEGTVLVERLAELLQ